MEMLDSLWGMIKAQFFCSVQSTIATLFLIAGIFFIYLLFKDNYEKLPKTLRNIVGAVMCIVFAFALF